MLWLDTLAEFAQSNLGDREREALWARGVTDEQIDLFGIGYLNVEMPQFDDAKEFLDWCWQGRKLDDVFVLPLTNTMNEIKGFQFRHVERSRTGYMDYIAVEDEPVLFGLGQAMPHVWEKGSIWMVEGAFDLPPIQRVYPNTIALLTARVSKSFTRVLRRVITSEGEVWMALDMDDTGRKGCETFVHFHGHEFKTQIVDFPRVPCLDGSGLTKDPSELWEAWGDARFGVFLRRLQDPYFTEENT